MTDTEQDSDSKVHKDISQDISTCSIKATANPTHRHRALARARARQSFISMTGMTATRSRWICKVLKKVAKSLFSQRERAHVQEISGRRCGLVGRR